MIGQHAVLQRLLPSTYTVLTRPEIASLRGRLSHDILVSLIHRAKVQCPNGIQTRDAALETIVANVIEHAGLLMLPARRITNATGIVIHTGFGTAPLSARARARMLEAAEATPTGAAGFDDRAAVAEHLLSTLTGAPDACITDQTAAACLLVGAAIGQGREIVCAARDLIEINHGVRLKDLFEATGARIAPVGSANCVRTDDYVRAITPSTGAVLRIWHSNYASTGYVSHAEPEALAALAHEHQLPFIVNLGAGSLVDLRVRGLPYSPTLEDALTWGTDLVLASGDKLVGGPQAGLVVGQIPLVRQLADHPLYRAVRPSKLTIGALEGTLASYVAGRAWEEIPVLRMLGAPVGTLERRSRAIAASLVPGQLRAEAIPDTARCGGAALPDTELPTWAVRLSSHGRTVDALYDRLASFGVIGRRANHAVLVDLRSVLPEDDQGVEAAIGAVAHYHPEVAPSSGSLPNPPAAE